MSIVFIISEMLIGSGGRSIVNEVRAVLDRLELAIPCTTRSPGIAKNRVSDFVFTSTESFELMIARDEFLEYVNILGNYYGTPHKFLRLARERGNDLLIHADYRGVEQIKKKVPDAVSILILPKDSARTEIILSSAIGPTSTIVLREALLPSIQEVFSLHQVPNRDNYDHVVVYDQLEDGVGRLITIIRAERTQRGAL